MAQIYYSYLNKKIFYEFFILKIMTMGKKVRLVRQMFGLGQKEFADKIDISQAQLSKIEADRQELTARGLYVLQSEFRIDADWLFGRVESNVPLFKEEKKEDDKIRELEQKLMKAQEQIIEYKTRENERLKNNPLVSSGQ